MFLLLTEMLEGNSQGSRRHFGHSHRSIPGRSSEVCETPQHSTLWSHLTVSTAHADYYQRTILMWWSLTSVLRYAHVYMYMYVNLAILFFLDV